MNKDSKQIIKPLAKLILAKIDAAPTKTASGLYLPESATEKPKTATVTAVGPQVKEVKVKDKIIYESYAGTEIKHYSEDYILVTEEKVLAIVS